MWTDYNVLSRCERKIYFPRTVVNVIVQKEHWPRWWLSKRSLDERCDIEEEPSMPKRTP